MDERAAGSNEPKTKSENSPLRQIRESADALFKKGKVDEASELFLSALEAVLVKNRDLEMLVAKLRRQPPGHKSERIDPTQLLLLVESMSESRSSAPINADAERLEDAKLDGEIREAEEKNRPKSSGKERKDEPGWTGSGIKREVHCDEPDPAERKCAKCGEPKTRIGEDVTRRLELVPAHFVEHVYHLGTWACGSCKEGLTTAPAPLQVLPRSGAGASLLGDMIVGKFVDHRPMRMLSRMYARDGAEIPPSTLADWMARAGELIEPLVERLAERVLKATILRTDATGILVLDPTSPTNTVRGSMWCYVGDDRDVLFRYTPTGEGETGPWKFLAGRKGYIQADASNTFDRLFNGKAASAIEIGCWCHGRRGLVELQDTDCRAAYPLKLIARLYRIEHLADARKLGPKQRAELRRERSQSVLDQLATWLAVTCKTEPPSTSLAKAAAYLVHHWKALTRFVDDGRLALDNNLCERQLRDIAQGRKNYLFAGSHDAARRAAAIYSLTRTCRQYNVLPLPYITSTLTKLAEGWSGERLDKLLPHCWRPTTT